MDTIAAIATPAGVGGIGIVRISGENALEIAGKIVKSKQQIPNMLGYHCTYGRVYDEEEMLDEVIVTVFRAPQSYTGENIAELSVHGGKYLLERVLRASCNHGARLAEAGEFTKRAFINGKLDLTQAEAVADLISAQGKQSARAALAARDGALFRKSREVVSLLVGEGAKLAAWIDYPEEDIEESERASIAQTFKKAKADLNVLLHTYEAGRVLRDGIETVIVGRPNVGKSSLMNLLSDCERSIVADIAGTTRDVVSDMVRLGNVMLHLSDTAGIRDTGDAVEQLGVARAENALKNAQLILAVFDGSTQLDENDLRVIEACHDATAIALVNKNDLPICLDILQIEQKFKYIIYLSAKQKEGIAELEKTVEKLFSLGEFDPLAATIANERQRESINRALNEVLQAEEALESGISLDAVGVCIETAADALMELTGEKAGPAVVNEIFARFCVGK